MDAHGRALHGEGEEETYPWSFLLCSVALISARPSPHAPFPEPSPLQAKSSRIGAGSATCDTLTQASWRSRRRPLALAARLLP